MATKGKAWDNITQQQKLQEFPMILGMSHTQENGTEVFNK